MLQKKTILGISLTDETDKKVSEYVLNEIGKGNKKLFITTPNPEMVMYAHSHPDYKDRLNSAELALPDGIGLVIASYLLGKPLKGRITGVDFMESLCRMSKEKPVSMGFLGGRDGVAERAVDRLKKKYPWLKVAFVGEDWPRGPVTGFPPNSARSSEASFNELRAVRSPSTRATPRASHSIDILFVAFGHPKQEEWIYENLPHIPVKAAMGVGGAFDYLSGTVPRAPKVIRAIGLEWLFRLIRQPWRWRRQLSLIKFVFFVLKEKIQG